MNMNNEKEIEDGISRLKKTILNDYPRMTKDDRFRFLCDASLSCFNKCCRDVTIFLMRDLRWLAFLPSLLNPILCFITLFLLGFLNVLKLQV